MTPENAIKILKGLYPALSRAGKAAIDAAVEAMEKQIGKPPMIPLFENPDGTVPKDRCCECDFPLDTHVNFCPRCGQRLDWSDIT